MKRVLLLICLLQTLLTVEGREVTALRNWQFYPAYDVSREPRAVEVTVPHSWNLQDVFNGMKYERGTYMYEQTLTLTGGQRRDKRFFLRFDGVNSYAEVAVNLQAVGHHAGGYTAFCMEITDQLKDGDNKLSVVVSNAYRTDVAPLAGDFNIYGGITRPVWLIVTGRDCISPLDYGSSGIYIHQDKVTPEQADLRIETMLSLRGERSEVRGERIELRVNIIDKEGQTVVAQVARPDSSCFVLRSSLKNPILWNGRQNPYLYKVRVELLQKGKVIDCVEEQTGFRYFSLDADKGFFLNGQHLDLHGVCRHEEGYQTGSLYNDEAMRQDADIISELGCTGVRFVHYPHSRYDVQQYDERGIVVWQELNLAGPGGYNSPGYIKNPQLEANVMQNLIEMVKQHYNSPAICFWSLCNELSFKYDEPATFLRMLHDKAKELDPQRLTTLAICYDQDKFQGITDCIGWNKYFGYYEHSGGVGDFMDKAHQEAGSQPIGLCEYGAAGSPLQHSFEPVVTNKKHYEENQARVHEENWLDMHRRDYAWCKFIWQYADNPSSIRDEGDQRGMNDKGIVSYDRTIRKDAYYFYKANWCTDPVLYIAARRYTQRTETVTDVKVYTNQPQATLYLNGKRIGVAKRDKIGRVVFKGITLSEGDNVISVKAGKLTDECRWTLEFLPTWQSLERHEPVPDWMRDAKFGIYCHWGVYSVPAYGNEQYFHYMHDDGVGLMNARQRHEAIYGPLEKFGYHDFIPMFKAERFNAAEWAELFQSSGARFAGLVGEHHDGFALWDSKYTPFNAKQMGPKRDVVGELSQAIRQRGMKFFLSLHHENNYYYVKVKPTWAANNPKYQKLYGCLMPREEWYQMWLDKSKEVVTKYSPDIIYFDAWMDSIPEQKKLDFLAHYFNHAEQTGQQVIFTYKYNDFPRSIGMLDHEMSNPRDIDPEPWLCDYTICDGYHKPWGYVRGIHYRSHIDIIQKLVEVVANNGQMLLNLAPMADGTFPQEQRDVVENVGVWLWSYGESIYGTRPFVVSHETTQTGERVYYTRKGNYVYVILLDWPGTEKPMLLTALKDATIKEATLLSVKRNFQCRFSQGADGLTLTIPDKSRRPSDAAHVIRLTIE